MKEKQIIKLIKNSISKLASSYIGDDAAYLESENLLISTDALIENIHFLSSTKPYYLGWKTVAVNISDIAAMGGRPKYIVLSSSLPNYCDEYWIKEFLRGLNECCEEYKVLLIGGDLTSSNNIYLSATIIGESFNGCVAKRSHAKPQNKIIVTGKFGASAAGLHLLQNRELYSDIYDQYSHLVLAHQKPIPKVNEGLTLIQTLPSFAQIAMMDSSDGLLDCLTQISEQSKVKMSINFENIPIDQDLLACAQKVNINPLSWIITGGEDYQLVATTNQSFDTNKWTIIGSVSEGLGVEIFKDNEQLNLNSIKAFEHF